MNKRIWLFIIIIELIFLGGALFVLRRQPVVELNYTQDDLFYDTGETGFYLDPSYYSTSYITTPDFTLPKGLYFLEVQLEYLNSSVMSIILQYSDRGLESNITGNYIKYDSSGASSTFRVKYNDRPMQIRGRLSVEASDGDYLLIRNIRIVSSPLNIRNVMFQLAAVLLIADLLVFLFSMRHRIYIPEEMQYHIKVLLALIFVTSIPFMVNYLQNAVDLGFHLMRIEGIKEGLLYGMFPVKIQQGWMDGYGYAASVFYGDLLFYIPAILRVFGVSVQAAYRFYAVLINTATVLIAYYCFRGMSNSKTGLVCTIVYSLNIFRLVDIYSRGAVGEYTAMTFIPLVIYGLWKVYMLPEESKEHQNSWIVITIGCCGIFFSHMITTEMTALFVVITIVAMWKKTFRKRTLLVLIKAASVILLLTCWFMVPFLDYMLNGNFVINNPGSYRIYSLESHGVFPAQLFMVDYNGKSTSSFTEISGPASEMPLTVGLSALCVLAGWFFLCLGKADEERDKSEKRAEYYAVFLCILSLWMTTYLFPYTWLINKLPFLEMPIRSIQFTWRFLTIAGALLVYLLCLILQKKWIDERKKKMFAGLLILLSVWQGWAFMSQCLNEYDPFRVYHTENLTNIAVGGGEYLPMEADLEVNAYDFVKKMIEECDVTYDDNVIAVSDWHRDKGAVVVSLTNNGNEAAQVEVPLLIYKGYHAVTDSGDELAISLGTLSRISVSIPAGFAGSFRVEFKEPWYWRVSELISLTTLLCLVFCTFKKIYTKRDLNRAALS